MQKNENDTNNCTYLGWLLLLCDRDFLSKLVFARYKLRLRVRISPRSVLIFSLLILSRST